VLESVIFVSDPIVRPPPDDQRVSRGLFTVAQAAWWLGVPRTTFSTWVHGYDRVAPGGSPLTGRPIVLSVEARRGEPAIPLIGLAEGLVLDVFRRTGLPLQRIRPALERLDQELGLSHALASDRLVTDGAEVLYDYGARLDPTGIRELVTVRSGQRVFAPLVRERLLRVSYAADHWAEQVELPGYELTRVVVNLGRSLGRPVMERAQVPVDDVVSRWIAGDSVAELAGGFALSGEEVEDVLRAATRRAAQ
jgi:uncharacterized protein (DUF433 family)